VKVNIAAPLINNYSAEAATPAISLFRQKLVPNRWPARLLPSRIGHRDIRPHL